MIQGKKTGKRPLFPVHLFDEKSSNCTDYIQYKPKFWGPNPSEPSSVCLSDDVRRQVLIGKLLYVGCGFCTEKDLIF